MICTAVFSDACGAGCAHAASSSLALWYTMRLETSRLSCGQRRTMRATSRWVYGTGLLVCCHCTATVPAVPVPVCGCLGGVPPGRFGGVRGTAGVAARLEGERGSDCRAVGDAVPTLVRGRDARTLASLFKASSLLCHVERLATCSCHLDSLGHLASPTLATVPYPARRTAAPAASWCTGELPCPQGHNHASGPLT